jgi:hypothetical protein
MIYYSFTSGSRCLLFLLFYFGLTESLFAQNWTLERDKSGVKVYTRYVEGWPLKQFKGIVNIKSSIKTLEKTLRNDVARSYWMYNTHDTKDVKKLNDNEIYSYSRVAAPWPVSDRDNVTKYTFKKISDNEMYIYFTNVSGIVPEQYNIIRLKRMEGHWHFKIVDGGYVQVTQQVLSEAGGSVPSWLANSAILDSPYHTLLNLKNYVEKGKI